MTGTRIKAPDCIHAGIATYHVPAGDLDKMIDALRHPGLWGDPYDAVTEVLIQFTKHSGASMLDRERPSIDRCFSQPTVEAIQAALEADESEWAGTARAAMAEKSPACQKVALRQLTRGASMTFEDCMVMEFRLSQRAMAAHDFYEGVRAAVIDKDRAPKWQPASLAGVSDADVEAWFTPLPDGDLTFP